ncbi:MAG TPA: hypothetical protein VF623_00920, partial [Segetibacter sp.]
MTQRLRNRITIARHLKILLVVFVVSTNSAFAAGIQNSPKPAARFLTAFPFRLLSGGVIILKCTLENFPDTLNFVLDTGSG